MKFIVKSPLQFDKKRYEPGDTVEMAENQGKPLVAIGVLDPPPGKQPEAGEKKGK